MAKDRKAKRDATRRAKTNGAAVESKRWLLDYEVEARSNGAISAKRLRKDRVAEQFFPFHRVGRTCYYDLTEIDAAIERSRFGGKAA